MSELPLLRIGTDPYEIHRIVLLSYVSLGAPPVSKSTKLATRIHGSQSYSLQLKYAIGTERSVTECPPWVKPELVGGKTTRIFYMKRRKQKLVEFKYDNVDYTTGG